MKKLSRISIFFFLFLAIGCSSQTTTPTSFPVTATIENTETPKPTSPPTTSSSPTSEQVTIEFPEWVKNPETQILLVPVGTRENGYENMALFNAETGEGFDIPFTEEVGDYFWMPDGSEFGFLQTKQKQIILFSILDGTTSNIPVSKTSLKYLGHAEDFADPLQILNPNFTNAKFLLIADWETISPDKNFFVYQEQYDETYTSILNVETDQLLYLSNPNDGYYDLYSEFSPNSQFLGIVEVDEEPNPYKIFKPLPNFRLRIYDVHTQQVVASYKNVTFPNWSPDGNKFLFQEWVTSTNSDGSAWFASSPPCIFDTISGKTKCFGFGESVLSSLQWSPDQTMIGFIYFDFNDAGVNNRGFCTITLSTEQRSCILEFLKSNAQIPINFKWSPNGNFISFEYDSTGPYSDESDNPTLGTANIATGEFFLISENIGYPNPGLWRPSPNP